MQYTIGIPVRNEENTLAQCVAAALAQNPVPSEVIICLNGSNEATCREAAMLAARHRTVNVIESLPGKPRAWNKIVEESKTDTIYFTDGDAFMHPHAAQMSLQALSGSPGMCVTGGDLFYLMPPQAPAHMSLFSNRLNRRVRSRNLSGANYAIRRDAFLALGKAVGIRMMPHHIIHEDVLIGTIARAHDAFIKNDSLVSIFPPTSVIDYARSHLRYKRSMLQLEESFPQYFQNGQPQVHLTESVPPRNRVLSGLRIGIDFTVNCYIAMTGREQSQQWTELRSTKPLLTYQPRLGQHIDSAQ